MAQAQLASPHGVIALEIVMYCDALTPWCPPEERVATMLNTLTNGLFVEGKTCHL